MYCSGCGQVLAPGQTACPQCGRPVAPLIPPVPPVPDLEFQVQTYAGKVKALSVVWFIYAAIYLIHRVASLTFAKHFLFGPFGPMFRGPWGHSPLPPELFAGILGFRWTIMVLKACLAVVVAWGLMERAPWARVLAIVAAFVFLLNIPFGTAVGVWTMVVLMGYRNATLYDQL